MIPEIDKQIVRNIIRQLKGNNITLERLIDANNRNISKLIELLDKDWDIKYADYNKELKSDNWKQYSRQMGIKLKEDKT